MKSNASFTSKIFLMILSSTFSIISAPQPSSEKINIHQLNNYFAQVKKNITCLWEKKKPCNPKHIKTALTVIGIIVPLLAIAAGGSYLYIQSKWQRPIEEILPDLAQKFNLNLDRPDHDRNLVLSGKEPRGPNDQFWDKETIILAAEGDEEALNKGIRAHARPNFIKAAIFIAKKRGHTELAQKLDEAAREEFLNWDRYSRHLDPVEKWEP
jgi:hypothetical protein